MSERTCLEELLQTDEGGLRTNEGGRGGEGWVESEGVEGVICGRAIYSGDLDFEAAQLRADELNG